MRCPNCGRDNPAVAQYCMHCGWALAAGDQPEPLPAAPGQPSVGGENGPQPAVQGQTRPGASPAGERRVVTILFCDLQGSTAAAGRLDPEEWRQIVNGAFERMIAPVVRYQGTVARLMGDGLLAFFGAPVAHEDDPQRAVLAGLEIVAGVRAYAAELAPRWGLALKVRVGINTGLVVVGEVGSDQRLEYTALGDAINLAARMEQTAEAGTVQIAEATYRQVAAAFEIENLGRIQVKGKERPVPAYRVVGRRTGSGRLGGPRLDGPRPALVGRRRELATLSGRLRGLLAGEGQTLAILGEAGLGKTRLIAEARRGLPAEGYAWLEGQTLSYGQQITFGPFQVAIRQWAGVGEEEGEAATWDKLERAVAALFGPETPAVLPYLALLLGLTVRSDYAERVKYLDAEAAGRQLFLVSRRLFERLAAERPLVLVFEDLHWADDASLRLFEHLTPLVERGPLLLLGSGRPDPASGWPGLYQRLAAQAGARHTAIRLQPLSEAESREWLAEALPDGQPPAGLGEQIIRKAEGNPYFLEEIVRSLRETPLAGRRAASAAEATIQIPDTLQGVILARLDRLAEAERQLLRTAAVVGRSFPVRVLGAVLGGSAGLEERLSGLADLGLIEGRQAQPEPAYAFGHA
ncbi:MAG: adenylate/guanylate cyclase domain-containing protein, partial [Candidatus Promineifilaceae bacterium]